MVSLIPMNNFVNLKTSMRQWNYSLFRYLHMHQMLKMPGGAVSKWRYCYVWTAVGSKKWHRSFIHPASVVTTYSMGLHKVNLSTPILHKKIVFKIKLTSWQYHMGLLHNVTTDIFCGRFIHTTLTSVWDTHAAFEK
jgi:hypothetical protein